MTGGDATREAPADGDGDPSPGDAQPFDRGTASQPW